MKVCIVFGLIFVSVFSFCAELPSLAVFDFKTVGTKEDMGIIPADFFRQYLFKTQKFDLVSRESMEVIFNEMKLQQSGCTSEECYVELGKVLLAGYILTGKLYKIEDTYFVTINLINVETAKIIHSDKNKVNDVYNLDILCGKMTDTLVEKVFSQRSGVTETYDSTVDLFHDKKGLILKKDNKFITIDKGIRNGVSHDDAVIITGENNARAVYFVTVLKKNEADAKLNYISGDLDIVEGLEYTVPVFPKTMDRLRKYALSVRSSYPRACSAVLERRRLIDLPGTFVMTGELELAYKPDSGDHLEARAGIVLTPGIKVFAGAQVCLLNPDYRDYISGYTYSDTQSQYVYDSYKSDMVITKNPSFKFIPTVGAELCMSPGNKFNYIIGLSYSFIKIPWEIERNIEKYYNDGELVNEEIVSEEPSYNPEFRITVGMKLQL